MEVLFFLVLAFIAGIFYGLNINVKHQLDEVFNKMPVNVKIEQVKGQYLAFMLHDNTFIMQHADINELIKMLEQKYPGRLIVVKEE